MITPEEFLKRWPNNEPVKLNANRTDYWGSYDLVTYNADSINRLAIPETSQRFLIQAGLPT